MNLQAIANQPSRRLQRHCKVSFCLGVIQLVCFWQKQMGRWARLKNEMPSFVDTFLEESDLSVVTFLKHHVFTCKAYYNLCYHVTHTQPNFLRNYSP